MAKLYIGIDPGVGGGVAMLSEPGEVFYFEKMKATERDVLDVFAHLGASGRGFEPRAVLEFVRSSPQMGVTSAFTFGRGYGGLRMALVAAGIPFEEATPQTWQKFMGCRTGGDKNVSKAKAQELFPRIASKITHHTADALLIAEYGRRLAVRGIPVPVVSTGSTGKTGDF